jgi:alpha-L-fucosidase
MTSRSFYAAVWLLATYTAVTAAPGITPQLPAPSPAQLAWQDSEFGMYVRLDLATLTGGSLDPKAFNLAQFDAGAWARTAKACGFRRVVFSANDRDGFCFWPTATTEFSVAHSAWRDGHGDLVKDVVGACRAENLAVGFAVCGYERGKPISDERLRIAVDELLTRYGPITELRFDGAGGEGNGALPVIDATKVAALAHRDWAAIFSAAKKRQPDCILVSNVGPDARWNGNNIGHCGEPQWSPFNSAALPGPELTDKEQLKLLNSGDPKGAAWIPAEAFIPLRPNWSWKDGDDAKLIVPDRLFSAYCKSLGRNCSLLVNVPVDPQGTLPEADIARLRELHERVVKTFAANLAASATIKSSSTRSADFSPSNLLDGNTQTYWSPEDSAAGNASVELEFNHPVSFNVIELREPITLGQRIATYRIEVPEGDGWKVLLKGKGVGRRKIERPPATTATKIRIVIEEARAVPVLSEVALYHD